MKKLIFTIWIIVLAVAININTSFSQNQWYYQNYAYNYNLDEVKFINSKTGWAVGTYNLQGLQGLLKKTTNGGANWIEQFPTSIPTFSVHFVNENTGWIVGGCYPGCSSEIFKTTDGGNSWIQQLSYVTGPLRSIHFIDDNTGWTVGDNSVIFKTINSGTNWIRQISAISNSLWSVHFVNSNTGWAVGSGNLYIKTTNGGANWTSHSVGIATPCSLLEIRFIDSNTGWITGGCGYIFKTTNGGSNWTNQKIGTIDFLALHFINSNTGWVTGSGGTILKTVNSGMNWTSLTSGTTDLLNSIYFVNESIGWVVGNKGTVLSTIPENDVGVISVIEPVPDTNNYVDCLNSKTINPKVTLKNFGLNNQNSFFDIKIEIKFNGSLVYSDIKQDTLSEGLDRTIDFAPYLIPGTATGTYSVKSWTILPTDINHTNDTATSLFYINNPQFGGGFSSNMYYYFANSSTGASCAPEQPVFSWEDTTGSTFLISDGVPVIPLSSGNPNDGYFILSDIMPAGNKFQFDGVCYDTFVISTNGIIGLGGNTSGLSDSIPKSIPNNILSGSAIYSLWYDLDFGVSYVSGRNLKYKASDNKIIFTYDKVPVKNASDAEDYVSFQVILETTPFCGLVEGVITLQYDNTKCGTTFLNKYDSNTIGAHAIGIQNTAGDKGIQYRFRNSAGTIVTPGYLFNSPLAVSFGTDNSVFPVELSSFTYSVNENTVTLNWQTNIESNNSGFDIERSNVKDQWAKAGFVQGNGNSNEPKNYSFTDKNLAPGKYIYRLKQIDFNGNFIYYDLPGEVIIGIPDKYELSQNYPNPFNPNTVIRYSLTENGFTSLKIYDITGREIIKLVNEKQDPGRYEVTFNGRDFASGVYFYELRSGEFVSQKRMLLLK